MSEIKFPAKESLLLGHVSPETAFLVEDYPYGFTLRCQMKHWLEAKPKFGMRHVTQTSNPKRPGTWNKPKAGQYVAFMVLYKDEKGHVHAFSVRPYERKNFPAQMDFLLNVVGLENVPQSAQDEIRSWYYHDVAIGYTYGKSKYVSEEKARDYKDWATDTIAHIKRCEFAELLDHDAAPEPDAPDAEPTATLRKL